MPHFAPSFPHLCSYPISGSGRLFSLFSSLISASFSAIDAANVGLFDAISNNALSKSFALTDMPKIMIADNIIMRFIFLIYLKLCNKLLEPQKCLKWLKTTNRLKSR